MGNSLNALSGAGSVDASGYPTIQIFLSFSSQDLLFVLKILYLSIRVLALKKPELRAQFLSRYGQCYG